MDDITGILAILKQYGPDGLLLALFFGRYEARVIAALSEWWGTWMDARRAQTYLVQQEGALNAAALEQYRSGAGTEPAGGAPGLPGPREPDRPAGAGGDVLPSSAPGR